MLKVFQAKESNPTAEEQKQKEAELMRSSSTANIKESIVELVSCEEVRQCEWWHIS
jgi:hypothetical protein